MSEPVSVPRPQQFGAYSYVCGAVGRPDPAVWRRLVGSAPVALPTAESGSTYAFASSAAPDLVCGDGRAWTWGNPRPDPGMPANWRAAAHDRGAAGMWVEADSVRLHTDGLGMHDIFIREVGGTTYFANRITPLTRITDVLLTTDWDAWGEHLAFGGMIGDGTGFSEIRRLRFGQSVVRAGATQTIETVLPPWAAGDGSELSSAALAGALRDQLPGAKR